MRTDPATLFNWLYENNVPRYAYLPETKAAWQVWRSELRHAIKTTIGLDRLEGMQVSLDPKKMASDDCGDYIRERYIMNLTPGLQALTYILIPKNNEGANEKNGQLPAVLACHGHGYGVKPMLGMHSDGKMREGSPDYHKDFAIELVKRGFVVAAPEIIGFGDSRRLQTIVDTPDENDCHYISTFLMMFGLTTAGLRVFQARQNIDFLQSLPQVDANRIGVMGISGGGLVASFAAALDERLKVSVISGYANSFKDSILSRRHCVDNYIPGLLQYCEMSDLLRLIAPRPCLLESGKKDRIFPIEAAQKALTDMQRMYQFHNAEDCLAADFFEGGHQIHGKYAYPWLEKWLF